MGGCAVFFAASLVMIDMIEKNPYFSPHLAGLQISDNVKTSDLSESPLGL